MNRWIVTAITLFLPLATAGQPPVSKLDDLAEGKPALKKVSSKLLQARKEVKQGRPALEAMKAQAPNAIRNGKIQCIIGTTDLDTNLLKAVEAAGLEIVGKYHSLGLNQIVVRGSDPRQFDVIAERADVRGVQPEPLARLHTGSVANQADTSIKADLARSTYSVSGSGVRVGVLSDSVMDVIGGTLGGGLLTGSSSQSSGDLPSSLRVIDAGPGGGTDEGAAMAELIYDLAPGCDISFASAFTSYAVFASNITALQTDTGRQCDVICDDVSYFAEPIYQDGPIAIAYKNAFAAGVACFSSAGNDADDAHERNFFDANAGSSDIAFPPSGVDLHDFGQAMGGSAHTHLRVDLSAFGQVIAILHWDEPYGGTLGGGLGSEADLDLYIVKNTTLPITAPNIYADSIDLQGTVGSPLGDAVEVAGYTNPTGATRTVYIVVDHYDGRKPVLLHLAVSVSGGTIVDKSYLQDRTIVGHPTADGVMAVAAMFYGEIDTNGTYTSPTSQLDVESYSSLGGNLPFYFSDDGLTRFGSPTTRFKPEITAPDGTNTTFFYADSAYDADSFPNFFGTSAAAPHAAAVAALMLERKPSLTPTELYSQLRATATDAETTGADFLSGDGLIDAETAVGSVPVKLSVFRLE